MSNLPEQAHQRGTAVATVAADNPYNLTAQDVILPRLRIAQYQSFAFKKGLAGYGDLVVGIGKEDPQPIVVAKGGDPLGEPLRFYVHRIYSGFNYREDPTDTNLTFGPLGGTFQQALQFTQGDPRRVYQKHDFALTVPAYEDLPVRFLMTSKWGGPAAKWINTQIGIALRKQENPLELAFQIVTRQSSNAKGDFAIAEASFAKVSAKDRKSDLELVASHAPLATSVAVSDEAPDAAVEATVVDAPGLD